MFKLLLIIVLFILTILLFKSAIKALLMKPEQIKFNLNVYFVDGYCNYNPVKIQKGKCNLKIENGKLYFEQDGNIIEDNIFDIYNIRTWTFKGFTYIAIRMKTSSEYKFSLFVENGDASTMPELLTKTFLSLFKGLCKKLKIDFVECGESQPNNDDDIQDDGESEE